MKMIYLCAAFFFLFSSKSATTSPEDQANKQTTETDDDRYFSVRLGDFTGRGLEGAYIVYSDSLELHFGRNTPTIKSVVPKQFATIISSIKPEKCLGKRVEYTAWVRAKDVKGWAGLWLRIDPSDPYKNPCLGFDNMSQRPIKGTKDWAVYHVVLDVPDGAASLVYGTLLDGDGQIWVDSMHVKIVDKTIPVTDTIAQKKL